MKHISYDETCGSVDMEQWLRLTAEDNSAQLTRLKRNLSRALRQDVTALQREYMMLYYGENMNIPAIARRYGVNKSTVSRTLKRGRERLYRCLRYGAANLLERE